MKGLEERTEGVGRAESDMDVRGGGETVEHLVKMVQEGAERA